VQLDLFHPEISGVIWAPTEITGDFGLTPLKTNMTLENPPFEDVFPIENGDFPMSC